MNFLAHFHLAWPDPNLVAGGLEGDYRKGPVTNLYADKLAAGVQLHRAIDAYTDQHPLLVEVRGRFPRELRRYAGILADLSFDHFLTLDWDAHSDLPLSGFAQEVYGCLRLAEREFSPPAQRMAKRLQKHDTLTRYGDWSAVPASAERIGERFKRGNPLLGVARDLDPLAPQLLEVFREFYPQLEQFSRDWRQQHWGHGLPGP